VAERLLDAVRSGDTVARFGGDEFVVVCEDVADLDEAAELGERLRTVLEAPFLLRGEETFVSASLGVALSGSASTPEDLLRDADAAMYHAKREGRARTQLFDAHIRDRAAWRRSTETDLRRALDDGQLHLLYQPIVSLEAGWIVGAEALIRWSHPDRGLVLPSEFIPVAEETRLIMPIGEWVLDEACAQLGRWRIEVPQVPLYMSINVSARQLRSGLAAVVAAAAARHNVDPSNLTLEITEGSLMDGAGGCGDVLSELKEVGVQIAIDDFGVGYSSLSYLKAFPIDVIKIDRAFISGLGTDQNDSSIVSAIAALARGLRVSVVAEGIETPQQLQALRRLTCQYAQGYQFAPPIAADEFAKLAQSSQRW
jgi:EAL domain-containing protein (putative c-di-GMP-specific phosphodiesterase class I)